MAGIPPTCSTCGSILAGYEWDKAANSFVYFCYTCRGAGEKVEPLKMEGARAETKEVPKAA